MISYRPKESGNKEHDLSALQVAAGIPSWRGQEPAPEPWTEAAGSQLE